MRVETHSVVDPRPIKAGNEESSCDRDRGTTGMRSAMIGGVLLGFLAVAWTANDLRLVLDRMVVASKSPVDGRRIDPNTGTLPEWTLIPGIGPAVAGRIDAARRERRGGDLGDVPGVGPITLREAAPHLLHPALRLDGEAFVR